MKEILFTYCVVVRRISKEWFECRLFERVRGSEEVTAFLPSDEGSAPAALSRGRRCRCTRGPHISSKVPDASLWRELAFETRRSSDGCNLSQDEVVLTQLKFRVVTQVLAWISTVVYSIKCTSQKVELRFEICQNLSIHVIIQQFIIT